MLLEARRDPAFRMFQREIRWALYSARKRRAVYNLLSGRPFRSALFSLDAYRTDPREVRDLLHFMRVLTKAPEERAEAVAGYAFGMDVR